MAAEKHQIQRKTDTDSDVTFAREVAQPSNSDSATLGNANTQQLSEALSDAGAGQSLDGSAREFLEPKFGYSFENVKIHADGRADELSKSVGARAFTTGQDVYFAQGEYQPQSAGGLHLLAHELTHTIQQSRGAVSGTPIGNGIAISDPSDSFEREAQTQATKVVSTSMNQASGLEGMVQRQAVPQAHSIQTSRASSDLIVLQRSLAQSMPTSTGGFEMNMQTLQGATATPPTKSGLQGTIKFIPSKDAPYSNQIGLIQIVKLTNLGGTDVAPQGMSPGKLNDVKTQSDPAKGVEGGYHTEVSSTPGSATPAQYPFGPGVGGGQVFGFKRSEKSADIKAAELFDAPGDGNPSANWNFKFETVAKGEDTATVFGAVKWGFNIRNGQVVDETASVQDGQSATFDAALEKHRDFYVHEPLVFYFDFDKSELDPAEQGKIDSCLEYLSRFSDVELNIEAFADHRGSAEYNKRLARQRGESVAQGFTAKGIAGNRIKGIGVVGATENFTKDATTNQDQEANRRGNRRVVVSFARTVSPSGHP